MEPSAYSRNPSTALRRCALAGHQTSHLGSGYRERRVLGMFASLVTSSFFYVNILSCCVVSTPKMSSFDLHLPLQAPLTCDNQEYLVNHLIALPLSPTSVTCPDNYVNANPKKPCSQVQHTPECLEGLENYKDQQKHYAQFLPAIHAIVKAPKIHQNQHNTTLDDHTLPQYIQHHSAFLSNPPRMTITQLEDLCSYLFPLAEKLVEETDGRQTYFDQCVCVGDAGHQHRLNLVRQFATLVKDECLLVLRLLEQHYFSTTKWKINVSHLKSKKDDFSVPLNFVQLFTLRKALRAVIKRSGKSTFSQTTSTLHFQSIFRRAKDVLITKTLYDFWKVCKPHTTFRLDEDGDIDIHAALQPIVTGLPDDVRGVIEINWKIRARSIIKSEVLFKLQTYGDPGPVTCLILDKHTQRIKGIKINCRQLQGYLLTTESIHADLQFLEFLVGPDAEEQETSYKMCLDAVVRNNRQWVKDVCSQIPNMSPDPKIQRLLHDVCTVFGFINKVQNAPTTLSSAQKQTLQTAKGEWGKRFTDKQLKNKQPPCGDLMQDLPYITLVDLVDLMHLVNKRLSRYQTKKRKREATLEA